LAQTKLEVKRKLYKEQIVKGTNSFGLLMINEA